MVTTTAATIVAAGRILAMTRFHLTFMWDVSFRCTWHVGVPSLLSSCCCRHDDEVDVEAGR